MSRDGAFITTTNKGLHVAFHRMLSFHGLSADPGTVEENCGTIWFKHEGHTYAIGVDKCEQGGP